MMKNKVNIYENKLIYIIIAMILIGTVLLYNASSTLAVNKFNDYSFFFSRHLIRLMISFLALFLIYRIKYTFLKINASKILYFSWVIMILAYFFNDGSSTSRWLIINGKNLFTTSDLAKLALIIYTAFFIEINKNRMNDLKLILKGYVPKFLITIILIFFQP
ncbi:FtsW/RodA/SpoVE family cell cycle protein, partial [Candidatus Marinimicrobia bacterium]|nr:FtsW/RodA/SpoVE family cell cycle protein [Candidatus Neomarinimicrobiota bacterium]